MKKYQDIDLKIIFFVYQDIVTSSCFGDSTNGDDNYLDDMYGEDWPY